MIWNTPFALLALFSCFSVAAGQASLDCTQLSLATRQNSFFMRYQAGSSTPLVMSFTDTNINVAGGSAEGWRCIQSAINSPSEYVLAENSGGTYCIEFVNSQGDNPQVVYWRVKRLEDIGGLSTDRISRYTVSTCQNDVFNLGSVNSGPDAAVAARDAYSMLILFNSNAFSFESNGVCPDDVMPVAYRRNVAVTDENILGSDEIVITYDEGNGEQCVGNAASRATRSEQGNRLDINACGGFGVGLSYTRPLFDPTELVCVAPQDSDNIGGDDDIHVFAVKIDQSSRWYFICARISPLRDPNNPADPVCWRMSLDLTNMDEPRCQIVSPINAAQDVSANTVGNGFTVVTGCYADCQNRGVSRNCMRGSACNQGLGRFDCGTPSLGQFICPVDTRGYLCEQDANPCSSNPCQNGGTCDRVGVNQQEIMCRCVTGWTGDFCTERVDPCVSGPCMNGGTCRRVSLTSDDYTCTCPDPYFGNRCQNRPDPCDPNPCRNGGTCRSVTNGFVCDCTIQYTGDFCGDRIITCADNPCPGETCENQPTIRDTNRYVCYRTCANNPCNNNERTCVDRAASSGRDRYDCVITCAARPCPRGVTCTDRVDTGNVFWYECDCPPHRRGRNCDAEDDEIGIVEIAMIACLGVLVLVCIVLGIWACFTNRCPGKGFDP